ncbi:MAG TPA: ABC-2 family transporter protein [Candidatus Saccharimonadales bacterium]|nr:ABC-2 family transporter protein [Candidatus Saccharimonadales bacterium]
MVARNLIKYLKIYKTLFKYSFIQTTAYRASFLFQIGVELGYQGVFVIFFVVIFGNVKELAGWDYNQILFLTGLNVVTSELIIGSIFIFGLWRLPAAIKDGDIDVALLKPVNALFNLSLAKPYFASILAAVPGLGLMWYAAARMDTPIPPFAIAVGVFLFSCGLVIAYSIAVIFSSLSFYFVSANGLPRMAGAIITQYKTNPFDVYQGALRVVFFFIIPAVFVSSVPAAAIVRTLDPLFVILSPVLAAVLLLLAIKIWNKMITYYSSASS